MLLAEPEKYKDFINAIKKAFMSIDLKKNLRKKYYLINESQIVLIIIVNFRS